MDCIRHVGRHAVYTVNLFERPDENMGGVYANLQGVVLCEECVGFVLVRVWSDPNATAEIQEI